MPTYEYRCAECSHQFEIFARMSDPDPETCPDCSAAGTLEKVLFPVAVHYKGSGFYSTDYNAKKPATTTAGSSSESSTETSRSTGDSSGSTETKSSESSSAASSD